ncbi:MAG: ABC transporter ATP-binding protein [Deltaproteobacteria bacterium]|nr:ABC transporter ATP-binding protein [Deltaproteobacteria bacterium]MBI4795200.1 ABC transporter ATP-binding protein [Deltaproteobacteria bacterium]
MLKVENIDVFYGDLQVLWDVSFEVKEGETVALVGANGAGKSTIIKTISGLNRPANGSIRFLDLHLDKIPSHKIIEHGIAHVPEGRRLFPEMTVRENLIMGSLCPRAKAKRDETMEWVFGLFPRLREREKQLTGTLSGGEQQMVAVGRGLMALPKLIMFDEPSLGLAPILVAEIFKIIQRIRQEGVTVLIVEQNTKQTLEICDRGYVLENGRILLSGTGQELLNNDHIKQAYLGI